MINNTKEQPMMAATNHPTFTSRILRILFPQTTAASYHVADRSVPWHAGSVSYAVSWFWVFALLVGAQVAYLDGWPKLVVFVGGNVTGLALVSALAVLVRRRMMGRGVTVAEFSGETFDRRTAVVYGFAVLLVQGIYAVLAQVIGARILLVTVSGFDQFVAGLLITAGVVIAALFASQGGLRNSLRADILKAALLLMVAVPTAGILVFGADSVQQGVQGIRTVPLSLFDGSLWHTYAFGLVLSLIAGASIDQQQWQRAYALAGHGAVRALVLGPCIFALLALGAGSLGFVAAAWQLDVKDPQTVAFVTIASVFPQWFWVPFILVVVVILGATAASALNAVSSVGSNDFVKMARPETTDAGLVWASRATMAVFVLVCLVIYWVRPQIQLLDLLIFAGAFRGALLMPTVLGTLTAPKRAPVILPYAIAVAMVAGVWVAIGMWPLFPVKFDTFYGGITALAISGAACLVELVRTRTLVRSS